MTDVELRLARLEQLYQRLLEEVRKLREEIGRAAQVTRGQ